MSLISATALARLRRLNTGNLPDRCIVTRPPVPTDDERQPGGSYVQYPVITAEDIRCRVSQPSESLRLAGDQPQSFGQWVVVFGVGEDIRAGDLLDCTLASDETIRLEVTGVNAPVSREMLRKAFCKLVTRD